jgi:CheY-like chemotaxis protein
MIDDKRRAHVPWATQSGPHVLLSVSDNGKGMSAETRERAFEPFFTTKPTGHGTGLGLATVYGIVEQHGGMFHAQSEVGVGTTMEIYLPVATSIPPERQRHGEAHEERSRTVGGSETILVAEDTAAVRTVVQRVLSHAGYDVLVASDGSEAIAIATQQHVDLILMDLVMPGTTGPAAARVIHQHKPNVPILYTTGYNEAGMLDEGVDVLHKPYPPAELLQRIRAMLDSSD